MKKIKLVVSFEQIGSIWATLKYRTHSIEGDNVGKKTIKIGHSHVLPYRVFQGQVCVLQRITIHSSKNSKS